MALSAVKPARGAAADVPAVPQLGASQAPVLFTDGAGHVVAGIKLENIVRAGPSIRISGWCFGMDSPAARGRGGAQAQAFRRHQRVDVNSAFAIAASIDTGFELEIAWDEGAEISWRVEAFGDERVFTHGLKVLERRTLEREALTVAPPQERLRLCSERLAQEAEAVLVVGGAPSVQEHLERIRAFDGEIWALNDAWLWLERERVRVHKVFVTDSRFFRKVAADLPHTQCRTIVTIDSVDLAPLRPCEKDVYVFRALGRDGFSTEYGEVYHGCSVYFTALQTAYCMHYRHIAQCGVLLPPPSRYQRIDGSTAMPEYVHAAQLANARTAMQTLRRRGVELDVFEAESNLHFI